MSSPSPPPNRLVTLLRSVMGNATWDAIKNLGKWAYDNWPLLVLAMGVIGSGITAAINRLRGIPSDLLGVLVVFGVAVFVALISYVVGRVRGKKRTAANRNGRDTQASQATERDLHAECEKRIARLLESEEKHATRATVHENALKTFRKEYAVPLAVADNQKAEIGKYLEVLRVCTHDPKLDDPMPTIKWAILVRNRSVHRVSLEGDIGPLFFEGQKLTEHKGILENKVMGLYPDREGSIIFEQRLSPSEVNLLKSLPNGKFEFDKVMLYARLSGSDFEHIPPDRVVIFQRFRATLGRCSDERSQAAEELSAEVGSLKAQLREARLNFDRDKMAERKTLIASWRTLVETANREYWSVSSGDYRFGTILEMQEGYLTLLPHLSKQTWAALFNKEVDTNNSDLLQMLAQDIAKVEQKWGL